MCNIRVSRAELEGFRGPFFNGLTPIQNLLAGDSQRINDVYISDVRARLNGDPSLRIVQTTDGYQWQFGLCFTHYDRPILILIPLLLDTKLRHGTRADRHVALYYQGDPLNTGQIERIARKAATAFEDAYEKAYGHIV